MNMYYIMNLYLNTLLHNCCGYCYRTLVSEGYPVPGSKTPLTKHDERNLKKVRRKIKNKVQNIYDL